MHALHSKEVTKIAKTYLVCREFARNCRCWAKLLFSASFLLLVLSFSVLSVSVSHVLSLSSLSSFFFGFSLSLSLVLSSVLYSLVFFFVLVFPGFCPFTYSVSLFFRGLSLSVPCSSFSPVFCVFRSGLFISLVLSVLSLIPPPFAWPFSGFYKASGCHAVSQTMKWTCRTVTVVTEMMHRVARASWQRHGPWMKKVINSFLWNGAGFFYGNVHFHFSHWGFENL